MSQRTLTPITWRTFCRNRHHTGLRCVRPRASRVGGTKQRYQRSSQRGRNVHRSRVHADHAVGGIEQRRQLAQTGLSHQIQRPGLCAGDDLLGLRPLTRAAEQYDRRVIGLVQLVEERSEVGGRPGLGWPARRWQDREVALDRTSCRACKVFMGRGPLRRDDAHRKLGALDRQSGRPCEGDVLVDRMSNGCGAPHALGV